MTLGYRIHTIIKGGEKLAPGVVSEFSDGDYREMLRLGAIRAPTADELALYNLAIRAPTADELALYNLANRTEAPAAAEPEAVVADEPEAVVADEPEAPAAAEKPVAKSATSARQSRKAEAETLV